MPKKLKILMFMLILFAFVFAIYNYILHGGERNLDSEKVIFEVTSKQINQEFSKNIDSANTKYLEKAITVSGIVTSIKNHELIVDNTIICNLKNIDQNIKVDQNISVKGRVVGYDDLMSELKLDNCSVNK